MADAELITTNTRFDQLEPFWNTLLGQTPSDHLFLTWEWLRTWWQCYPGSGDLYILVIKDQDHAIAIAPLFRKRRSLLDIDKWTGRPALLLPFGPWDRVLQINELAFLGAGSACSEYLDMICLPGWEDVVANVIYQWLIDHRRDWDILNLTCVRTNSFVLSWLAAQPTRSLWQIRRPMDHTWVSPLPDSWGTYTGTVWSNRFRKSTQRHQNRIRKIYREITFDFHTDPTTLETAVDTFIQLHQKRWIDQGLRGGFSDPASIRFHKAFSQVALKKGWLRLGFLKGDGNILFGLYGFRYGPSVSLYQMASAVRIPNLSVGTVALCAYVRHMVEEGAGCLDLLGGDFSYKRHWTKENRTMFQVKWGQRTSSGFLFYLHDAILASPSLRPLRQFFKKLLRYSSKC